MKLIDIITYFSKCFASLIYFPTNWILITMWLSMEEVLVSSVSIIFDYHVSLDLADILHNFCVSYCSSSLVLHTFQGISHHWLISLQIGVTLPCGCPWMQYLFRQCPLFRLSRVPKSCWHSTQFLCVTMMLIDSILYFSKYFASLIDFPTNWSHVTMWLSMDAVLVSSVSIIFDYHVFLNLANILYNFCVSQWGSSILLHTFQSISHHWFISLRIGFSLPCGCPWKKYLFRQCPLFSIIMCP